MDKPAQKQHNFVLSSKYTQELNAKQDGFAIARMSMLFSSGVLPFAFPLSQIVNATDFLYIYTSNHDAETRTRLISSQKE
jgi:hypothetical protein